jgi:hypothetical protein
MPQVEATVFKTAYAPEQLNPLKENLRRKLNMLIAFIR